jgi:hypothetical protein
MGFQQGFLGQFIGDEGFLSRYAGFHRVLTNITITLMQNSIIL